MSEPEKPSVNGKARNHRRRSNRELRSREWLEEDEVKRMMKGAKTEGRHGHRDATMILVAYRHGLRASELVSLKWDQVDLDRESLYVRRCKGSRDSSHTLKHDEIAALRKLGPDRHGYVFRSERQGPLSVRGFGVIVARAGAEAGLGFTAHPHMLRHACGHSLINADVPIRVVQDWLGHVNIRHTVDYSVLSPERFRRERIWSRTRAK